MATNSKDSSVNSSAGDDTDYHHTLINSERCTAMTMHKGRCRWARVKSPTCKGASSSSATTLCSHHLADFRRGCSSANHTWHSKGEKKLSELSLSRDSVSEGDTSSALPTTNTPMIALRVHAAHISRVVARMHEGPIHCSLSFQEETRKGKTILMLFTPQRGDDVLVALTAVMTDEHMLRILAGFPAVVTMSTLSWNDAAKLHAAALYVAQQQEQQNDTGVDVRIVTDPVVRSHLQKDISREESMNSSTLAPCTLDSAASDIISDINHNSSSSTASLVCVLSAYDGALFLCGCLSVCSRVLSSLLQQYQRVAEDRSSERVCKAVLKIEEIFSLRDWGTAGSFSDACEVAVDIGASPGSWSAWLLAYMDQQQEQKQRRSGNQHSTSENGSKRSPRVVAVDPGDLSESVLALDGVQHLRVFVSREDRESMEEIARCVQGKRAEEGTGEGSAAGIDTCMLQQADILVCDMNRHPREASALLSAMASGMSTEGLSVLAEGCRVVLTLKLPVKGAKARQEIQAEALEVLGSMFYDKQVHHLFGNTTCEVTVTAVFHSSPSALQ